MGRVAIDQEKCKGCRLCVGACPRQLLVLANEINSKGYHPASFDPAQAHTCTGCALCGWMCPDAAITVQR